MMAANYFDQFDSHPAGPAITPTGIRIGTPDPAKAYDPALKAADLAAKGQEAQIRALQLQKLRDEQGADVPLLVNSSLHGDDYLKQLPAGMQGLVRGIASGNLAPPNGMAMRNAYNRQLLQHVINYDPSFAQQDYGTRAKMRAALAAGTFGNTVNSINTALNHGAEVAADAAALGNYGGLATQLNFVKNMAGLTFGDPRVRDFQNDVRHYGDEMSKVFAGTSGGSAAERRGEGNAVPLNGSPEEQMGVLRHNTELLKGKLDSLTDEYRRAMGTTNGTALDLLSPDARKTYESMLAVNGGVQMPPGIAGAGGPSAPGGGSGIGGSGPSGPSAPAGGGAVAGGATRVVDDPDTAALVDRMVRSGATADQINAALPPDKQPVTQGTVSAAQAYLKANPGYKGSFGSSTKLVPQTLLNRAVASPLGTAVMQGVDAATAGTTDEAGGALESLLTGRPLSQTIAEANAAKQAQAAANPGAAFIGDLSGGSLAAMAGGAAAGRLGLTAALGRFAPLTGDLAYGAAYSAGENNDNRLAGAGIGALAGVGGSYVGNRAASVLGGGLRGVQNAAVRTLDAAGVPMTGGQILGGTAKAIEDKLTSLPFVGDAIKARRGEGYHAFNEAAFRQAGQPIGAQVQGVGDAGLANLDHATGQAYGAALDGVTVNGNDPRFVTDMQAVIQRGQSLPREMADNARYTLGSKVGDSFDPATGDLTGRNFQQAIRGLRQDAAGVLHDSYGHDFGQVTRGADDALTGLLERQAPGVVPAYRAANATYRNQMVLADAVKAAKNQIDDDGQTLFTPAQLNTASSGPRGMFAPRPGSTTRPFYDLARSGQQVLPSRVPDSGSAGRISLALLPSTIGGSVLGGIGGYEAGDTRTGSGLGGGLGLVAGLLNTRAGQQALTAALLRRPQALTAAGNALVSAAPVTGMLGRSAAVPLLLGQRP